MTLLERFWSKVEISNDCWNWTAYLNNKGYGKLQVFRNGKWESEYAHRVSWFLHTGYWPQQNVLHSCDNPRCVRHSHHFEGTQNDNLADCKTKKRNRGGKCYATHCKRGHDLVGDNVYMNAGKRHCKECRRQWKRDARRLGEYRS